MDRGKEMRTRIGWTLAGMVAGAVLLGGGAIAWVSAIRWGKLPGETLQWIPLILLFQTAVHSAAGAVIGGVLFNIRVSNRRSFLIQSAILAAMGSVYVAVLYVWDLPMRSLNVTVTLISILVPLLALSAINYGIDRWKARGVGNRGEGGANQTRG